MGVTVRQKPKGSGIYWCFLCRNRQRKSWKIGPKRKAELFADVIRGKLALGRIGEVVDERNQMSFKETAGIWLDEIMPVKCKLSTVRSYQSIYRVYLSHLPFWDKPVNEITKAEVKQYLYSILIDRAASTVQHVRNAISGVFNVAIEHELLDHNPATNIPLIKATEPVVEPFNHTEIDNLLDAAQNNKYYLFILLLVKTGCRIGEAAGMQWDDINFQNRTWHLRRNIVLGKVTDTKSKRARVVDLSPMLSDALLKADRRCQWVFPNQNDNIMSTQNWRSRHWYRLLEREGLRKVNPHSLRHSYVSQLIEAGANLVYIQRQCGHADISTTIGRYGHLLKRDGARPVDLLDR